MKVLLVNPPLTNQAHLPGTARVPMDYHDFAPPIGLMYIKAIIEDRTEHDVRMWNFQKPRPPLMSEFESMLREWQPQVVGITVMTWFWYHAVEVAKAVKRALPTAVVVAGGAHIRVYPAETLSRPEFDVAVVGEGEYTFLELLDRLESGESLAGLPGTWHKDGGVILQNPPRQVETDPDNFPFPDRSGFDPLQHQLIIDEMSPSAVMMSSRGCANHCTFCQNYDRLYRMRKASRVVDEILACKEMGYKSIDFYDDNFNQSRRHVVDFCEEMISRQVDMTWMCRCRVNKIDREMIELMRKAGCRRIHFGVESANQEMLDLTRKGITVEEARNAIGLAKSAGISTLVYFILGFPGETAAQARNTVRFALELDPDYVIYHPLIPMPGTIIYEKALADPGFGGDYLHEFALNPAPGMTFKVWPTAMTEKEILSILHGALVRFYFRPKVIWRFLRRLNSPRELVIKARTALRLLKTR